MNILYGIPGSSIGGGVNVVLEHSSRLQARGHNVIVLNLLGSVDLGWNPIKDFTILSAYNPTHMELIRALDYDAVVATGWQTVYDLMALDLKSRAFFYFLQADEADFNPRGSRDWQLARYTRDLPFRYISCANWLAGLVPQFECVALVNGLNHDIFYPDFPLVPKGRRVRVLIEGPIAQPRKRIEDAFLACELSRDLIEVWCVSSGGVPAEWQKPDMFFSKVPMQNMRNIYSSCDIIMKLSSAEGMFGPPLEMMACGGTAITSNCSGHEEYMKDGINGVVVPVGDIAAAAEAVRRLAEDRELLKSMQDEGRSTAALFHWEPVVDRLEALFLTVDGQRSCTMPEFLSRKGVELDDAAFQDYFSKSYGSLPAPVSGTSGFISRLLASHFAPKRFLRLRFWIIVETATSGEQSRTVPHCKIVTLGSGAVYEVPPNIERPDIAFGYGNSVSRCGFDVVIPDEEGPDRSKKTSILLRPIIYEPDSKDAVPALAHSLDQPAQLVSLHSDEHGTVGRFLTNGALEGAEYFHGYEVAIPRPLRSQREVAFTLKYSSSGVDQFLFYQKENKHSFENQGLFLSQPVAENSVRVTVPLRASVRDSANSLLLLGTHNVRILSLRYDMP